MLDRPRQPMRSVRLDYSKRWQHSHWGALVACYKASPYFEHYAPELEPFYRREGAFERLVRFDSRCSNASAALSHAPSRP